MPDDPLALVNLRRLMSLTTGSSDVAVGLIDGPVEASVLPEARLRALPNQRVRCRSVDSAACLHGTFIAGILSANRTSGAPAICPDCTLVVKSLFCEEISGQDDCPKVDSRDLARAILEVASQGVRIINLSLGLSVTSIRSHPDLEEAIDAVRRLGVLLVVASGNQGRIGHVPLFLHTWAIPVAACDERGYLDRASNIGPSIARSGLMAPGTNIRSISPQGTLTSMSGSSVAAAFVTGALALLWSLEPQARAPDVRRAIIQASVSRKSIVPLLLDAEASLGILTNSMCDRR